MDKCSSFLFLLSHTIAEFSKGRYLKSQKSMLQSMFSYPLKNFKQILPSFLFIKGHTLTDVLAKCLM